jgi:hypothetical protein
MVRGSVLDAPRPARPTVKDVTAAFQHRAFVRMSRYEDYRFDRVRRRIALRSRRQMFFAHFRTV